MRVRLFLSTVLMVLYGIFRAVYTPHARSIVQAQLAPLQIGNEQVQYGLSRAMNIADFVAALVMLLLLTSLIFIWLTYYLDLRESVEMNLIGAGSR